MFQSKMRNNKIKLSLYGWISFLQETEFSRKRTGHFNLRSYVTFLLSCLLIKYTFFCIVTSFRKRKYPVHISIICYNDDISQKSRLWEKRV